MKNIKKAFFLLTFAFSLSIVSCSASTDTIFFKKDTISKSVFKADSVKSDSLTKGKVYTVERNFDQGLFEFCTIQHPWIGRIAGILIFLFTILFRSFPKLKALQAVSDIITDGKNSSNAYITPISTLQEIERELDKHLNPSV